MIPSLPGRSLPQSPFASLKLALILSNFEVELLPATLSQPYLQSNPDYLRWPLVVSQANAFAPILVQAYHYVEFFWVVVARNFVSECGYLWRTTQWPNI